MIDIWAWYVAAAMEAAKPVIVMSKTVSALYLLGIEMSHLIQGMHK